MRTFPTETDIVIGRPGPTGPTLACLPAAEGQARRTIHARYVVGAAGTMALCALARTSTAVCPGRHPN